MAAMDHIGRDELGRDVFLLFVADLHGLLQVNAPAKPFVIFIGADTNQAVPEPLFTVARSLLDDGAVYVMCWGPGLRTS
jgi:hypothetical protein